MIDEAWMTRFVEGWEVPVAREGKLFLLSLPLPHTLHVARARPLYYWEEGAGAVAEAKAPARCFEPAHQHMTP